MAIICATDFSQYARHAQAAAAALAARLGEPLWFLHVQEPESDLKTASAPAPSVLHDLLTAEAERYEPLARKPIKVAVKQGRAAFAVRDFAKSLNATLIVIGSAGHSEVPLVKLGGTSERLASGSEIPVLVVREGDSFLDWGKGKPFRALLGLEEGEASASALRWLTKLRAAGPLDVVVGRVYYAHDAHQHYGVAGQRRAYTDPDPAVESLIERDLKRMVPSLPGEGELFYRAKLGMGRVADHLLELAEGERCQLVVVGSHKHSGLSRMWSVSSATLHLARMAVATIPPDGKGVGALVPTPRLERVLVATDFSELGNAAVPWAYTMVRTMGEVILAHVTPREGAGVELPAAHASPRVEAEVSARLRVLAPASAMERGVVTRTEVLSGSDPARALLVLSDQLGVDAIVLSSHGRSGVLRAVHGSVAEAVLRGSTRPVLVVRQPHA